MKKILFIPLITLFFSCNMERNAERDESEDHVSYDERKMVEGEAWGEDKIIEFLSEAAQIDKAQITIGKMAQEKASNESVGIYGKLLVDDHTYSFNNLQKIAQGRQIGLRDTLSNKFQLKIADLEVASGQEFDREFLKMMEEDHRKDIQKYENALTSISNEHPAKSWVDNTLTSLRRHLQKAQQLQRALGYDTTD